MNERRACDSSGSANAGQNCTGHAGAENEWKVQARARETEWKSARKMLVLPLRFHSKLSGPRRRPRHTENVHK